MHARQATISQLDEIKKKAFDGGGGNGMEDPEDHAGRFEHGQLLQEAYRMTGEAKIQGAIAYVIDALEGSSEQLLGVWCGSGTGWRTWGMVDTSVLILNSAHQLPPIRLRSCAFMRSVCAPSGGARRNRAGAEPGQDQVHPNRREHAHAGAAPPR